MFALFRRITASPTAAPIPEIPKGLLRPESADELLATPRRQKLMEHIWQRTALSHSQFAALYGAPLGRYAELVQQFPASESHHHAYPGGMLDHGLEIVAYALKLRQSHLLPIGAPPETQAAQAEAWTACVAYAALLHDIGKIAVDLHVEYADGARWHPWHGRLTQPYRFRHRPDRAYRLHNAAVGLLYTDILDKQIMDWLCGYSELWSSLLYVLAGQHEHAGILGELVTQADQASVAHDLGGDPAKARLAPKHALQRKLLDGLRYLLKQELRLNQPQASDGWLTQDALWLVSKTVCDKLRAHLLSQGLDGIPDKNTAVFNVLQEHGIVQPAADGKAIWKATVSSDGGWSHSFTFLKIAPALIWDASDRPAAFAGSVSVEETAATDTPQTPTATPQPSAGAPAPIPTSTDPIPPAQPDDSVSDVLALLGDTGDEDAPANTEDTAADSAPLNEANLANQTQPATIKTKPPLARLNPGEPIETQFVAWLRNGIRTRRIKINEAQALVHTVADTAFVVTPGIFHRFVLEHPEISRMPRDRSLESWAWVQRNFTRLGLHKKQDNDLNIWTCEVSGPRKTHRLHGYLFRDSHTLFEDAPFDNPYLKLLVQGSDPKNDAA